MDSPSTRPAPRYRRRILGIGALLTVLLFVIGAPIFNDRIEHDLERRVPSELAELGYTGIVASFSGQDGTLRCTAPLDDPEQAIAAAYEVWGVRTIEVDRSCRVNRAPLVETTTTLAAGDVTDDSTEGDGSLPDDTVGVAPVASTPPDFDTVADVVAATPRLSLLAALIQESGLSDIVGAEGDEAITLFAPTDEAWDALAADAFAKLRANAELLQQVLSHHVAAGSLLADDLVDGALAMLDGDTVEIATDGPIVTVSGARIATADIAAANGMVHIIDQVLVPDEVDLTVPGPFAATEATLAEGRITLSGVVSSEVERAVLTAAVNAAPGSIAVDDQLTVDPDSGIDAVTTASLAQLVTAMPSNLLNGVSGFDGAVLYVSGTYLTQVDRDAMIAVAEGVGASIDLQPPPEASENDATDLEAELNAYVAANPILFQPSSSVLADSSIAVLDRLALLVQQFAGVAITVEGHTDSDGDPAQNQVLSQLRAFVVSQALIDRGIPAGSLTAVGFGSEQPILVDGVEDKAASRRVEFRVVATS